MQVAEIHMLQFMNGVFRKDRIRDDYVRGSVGVVGIKDKMRSLAMVVSSCDEAGERT